MKASLQLRLSQHLALTPQLQQSIRLLQLSTLELQQEVAMAISQNPLLENEDDWIASPLRVAADGSLITQAPGSSAPADSMAGNGSGSSDANGERADNGEPQSVDEYNGLAGDGSSDSSQWNLDDYGRSGTASDDDDLPPLQIHESSTSLRDHLMAQLRVTQAGPRDRALITFLIESLDDDGYLAASFEEVLADLPEELEVDIDELNAALALLHSFDPAGVGARSASECLKLQLLRLDPSPTRTLALDIVGHHLELLAARDFTRLRKHLKASDDDLRDAHSLIRSLEPFPGAAYGKAEADYVVPDIMVRRTAQGWQAELNPEVCRSCGLTICTPIFCAITGAILAAVRCASNCRKRVGSSRISSSVSRQFCGLRRRSSSVRRAFLCTAKSRCAPWFCGKLLIRWAYTSRLSRV
jgi:RNA polymerase sigma-54 factor